MDDWHTYFRGKRITVMGAGLLGGVGDIRFLAQQGADLIVTDLKPEADLKSSLEALKEFPHIRYTLGKHELADFKNRDLIVMAPGTPLDSPYIAEARKNGITITMWAALFSRFAREAGAAIIGVTGTRGKTTTTEMIARALRPAQSEASTGLRSAGKKVIAGGNISGTAMLPHLPELAPDAFVVLELDSWKIQGFREERLSPDIAVFTTFFADHLNYYLPAVASAKADRDAFIKVQTGNPAFAEATAGKQEAMDLYLADKAEIFLHQGENDTLVLGEQAAPIVLEAYEDRIKSHVVIARAADLPERWQMKIPGEHNRANAACAMHALQALGIADEKIQYALETFTGLKDRLELVREIGGVKYYNDTTATTPEATIAALRALDPGEKKNIILIMGGSEKNLDMSALFEEIPKHCKEVVLLSGTGTSRILPFFQLPTSNFQLHGPFDSLRYTLVAARTKTHPGDIVLLSPAFASFGMFKNEYDRGEQFRQIVKKL